ncbi:MAG TPA: type I-U CRISPR-associated protein Csb2 [Xanthobacteraceae bacterium]|nr:type I-U CRISPR-associated protein Csb2 [Xanthobacteraceae bacterium]
MASRALLIEVRLLDGRYHGVGDWPPSPFRLYQSLVAGAYGGRWRGEESDDESEKDAAFRWLEALAPPHIAAPPKVDGKATTYFVPNNDIDAVDGDPRRVSEIRAGKLVRPILLAADAPLLYAWPFDDGEAHALRLCALAERLHTLGRGIDAAFARAEVCDWSQAEARLADHPGPISRPGGPGDPKVNPFCPVRGSLDSLRKRHAAGATRLSLRREGRGTVTLFEQPPKPVARAVAYDRAPARLLFDVRNATDPSAFRPVAQEQASLVAAAVREVGAWRLKRLLGGRDLEIDRLVVGRGATAHDVERRVRIIPLPTIGHVHASPSIRRVLVEIPPDCPLPYGAVMAALANQTLDRVDVDTGEIVEDERTKDAMLVPADDDGMLWHYGIGERASHRWQTVTPAALSEAKPRGRVGGVERGTAEERAAGAVAQSLRHAGFDWRGTTIRVQSEPFRRRGARADDFLADRFAGRLRHVEIAFPEPVHGPLVIGDGRWLGLGVMAPVREGPPAVHIFAIDPSEAPPVAAREQLTRALRNAVMARVDDEMGGERGRRGKKLPTFFTGHVEDGAPARSSRHEHLFFLADDADGDGRIDRLAVIAPHLADRTVPYDPDRRSKMQSYLELLDSALAGLTILRAGRAGAPHLGRVPEPGNDDPIFGSANVWISLTPYRTTRYPKGGNLMEAAAADLIAESVRRGLPRPAVEAVQFVPVSKGGGLGLRARLRFGSAVKGPLLLGRDSHAGGGLFAADG